MKLTFLAKRRLQRIGLVSLVVILVAILVWLCWVVWLERYVVYSEDGATLNFDVSNRPGTGQIANPPSAGETVPIYINEGSNAIDLENELTQLSGYYVDTDMLQNDLGSVRNTISTLPSGTAVMLELKNIWGSFFYSTNVTDSTLSNKLDVTAVDSLITDLNSRNLYTIAKIPAFRERYYFLIDNGNTSCGFAQSGKGYLWSDEEKCYWMDPTDDAAITWIISIVKELKDMGFDEVVFSEFRIPSTDRISFSGDRTQAIQSAASKLVTACATENFAVSFMTSDTSFPLPEGRTRIYLESVSAKNVGAVAAQVNIDDPQVRIVFVSNTNDTRFDEYGVMRPISMNSMNQ